jgi:amino acid efflux transporter
MLRELTAVPGQKGPNGHGRPPRLSAHALLGIIALVGLLLIGLSALRLADIVALVSVPTAMFLCVYLSCTAAATRILAGPARVAAAVAVLAVLAVLAFCGWQALLAAAVVAAVASLPRRTVSSSSVCRRPNPLTIPLFSSRTGTAIDHP